MSDSFDPVAAVEFLDKEQVVRAFVDKHIEALRAGVGSGDYDLLANAFDAMYADFLLLPDFQFAALELMMMLAANTSGPLLVGVGEIR